jgi:hypothetical protein
MAQFLEGAQLHQRAQRPQAAQRQESAQLRVEQVFSGGAHSGIAAGAASAAVDRERHREILRAKG